MLQRELDNALGVQSHERTDDHENRIHATFWRLGKSFVDVLDLAQLERVQLHGESFRRILRFFEISGR